MEKARTGLTSGYILAITGASGAIYAKRFIEYFSKHQMPLNCIISDAGRRVWEIELEGNIKNMLPTSIPLYSQNDLAAPMASGSFLTLAQAMVILPCSMGTLANIAQGLASNLISRAADVMLKERRPLILVPRETPLNRIHLQNMLKVSEAGAIILPAMPGFYHRPQNIQDMVDFLVGKILDTLGLPHEFFKRWGSEK
ncbi:MAG TPA: UbiX family flavin prenyltransferase [Syntrophaceae bacterium]|nr:UbiX family flavin prenyltransferase [Syntrophaceae bacterium]